MSTIKPVALVVGVAGLGVLLGTLMMTPSRELVISSISSLAFLLLTMANPLIGLIVAIITAPLNFHFAVINLGEGIPDMSVERLIIFFLAILIFFQVITYKRRLRHFHFSFGLAALLFILAYASSFYNYDWSYSRSGQFLLDTWVLPIIIYFIVSNIVDDEPKLDIALNLLLVLGVYSALYMMYEQVTGNILFKTGETIDHQYYGGTRLRIVRGLYGTTTTFGNLFNLLIPINIYYLIKTDTISKKVWYSMILFIMLMGIFFTYKRSVWLGILLSFLVIQWFYPQFRKLFFVLLFISVVAIAASWNTIGTSEVMTSRVSNTEEWESANGRTELWSATIEYWKQSPIFGRGFRYFTRDGYQQTENLYIDLLVAGGLVLFIPFVTMFLIIIKNSVIVFLQAGKNQRLFVDRNLIVVFWGQFIAYFFMAYFGSGVEGHFISNFTLFTIMGVLVGSQIPLLTKKMSTKAPVLDWQALHNTTKPYSEAEHGI